ncbi:MAG: hypothetical protein AAGE59_19740 [Cyanobacteria bacterium P01_F01_bin.86]
MPLAKRRQFFVACAVVIAATGLGSAAIAQSFLPGGGGLDDVLGGQSIYSAGSLGAIFEGGLGDIFGDVLGGDSGELLEDIFGGTPANQPTCGDIVIVNIAPDYDCTAGNVGGNVLGGLAHDILSGNSDSIFDTVFDIVGIELGLPEEIMGVITGKNDINSIFQDILDEALGSIGVEIGGGEGSPERSVFGAAGLPDYENLLESMSDGLEGETEETPGLLTPNVISSLIRPVQVMDVLTDTTAARILSEEGQEIMMARQAAGKTATETSAMMSQKADITSQAQVAVAQSMAKEIDEQISTQDTLKVALAGMNLLQAQATEFDSIAANQRALFNQMGALGLDIAQEANALAATAAKGAQLTNEQLTKEAQERMAEQASVRHEFSPGVKMLGAYR